MTRRAGLIAVLLALAVAALAAPLILAARSTAEIEEVRTGSLDYRFRLPSEIKAVPVVQECLPAIYDYFPSLPNRPALAAVSYASLATTEGVALAMRDHFTALDCTPTADGAFGRGLLCPDGTQAFLDIRDDNPCTFVNVTILYEPAP